MARQGATVSGARAEAVNLDRTIEVDSGAADAEPAAGAPRRAVRAARLLAALLPWRCVLCGDAGAGRDLCRACSEALPRNLPCCPRCALPLAHPGASCGACLREAPPWRALVAPYRYAWPVDRLVARYKFAASLASGAVLADLLAAAADAELSSCGAIVPVPLSRERLRSRGFNQALELARPLARASSLPLRRSLLERARDTAAQSGLGAAARARNVRGAFEASRGVAAMHVALVDDVVTTGATAAACCDALLAAGAASVLVLAIARAAPPAL